MGIKIDTKQNNMTPFNFDRLHESQGDKKKKRRRIKKSSKTHHRLKPHHKKKHLITSNSTMDNGVTPLDEAAYAARLQRLHHTLWHVCYMH
jgi:hypothetical protein